MNVMEMGSPSRAAPIINKSNDYEKVEPLENGGETFKESLQKSEKTQRQSNEVKTESNKETDTSNEKVEDPLGEDSETAVAQMIKIIEINYAISIQAANVDLDQESEADANGQEPQAPNQILNIMSDLEKAEKKTNISMLEQLENQTELNIKSTSENAQGIAESNKFVDLANMPEAQETTNESDKLAALQNQYEDFNVETSDPSVSELMNNNLIPVVEDEGNTITFVSVMTAVEGEQFQSKPELVVNQIDFGIKEMISTNKNSLNIQIHPEQLGKINIKLVSNADGLQIFMTSEKGSTTQLLESNLDQLHSLLQDAGVNIGGMNINLQQQDLAEDMYEGQDENRYNLHVSFDREEELIPMVYPKEFATSALDFQA
ncbi:MAG: flagellar hook-length control protein FliK [Anaerolineaceae bacterium]|nr:flagellar hook-length control protein FliK [Anaerolineaceae bacterium]